MLCCRKSYVSLQPNTCCCVKTKRIVRLLHLLYFRSFSSLVSSQVMKAHCLIGQDQDKRNIFFRKPSPMASRSTCLVTTVVDPWLRPGKQPHYLQKGFCCRAELTLMTSLVKLKCTMGKNVCNRSVYQPVSIIKRSHLSSRQILDNSFCD